MVVLSNLQPNPCASPYFYLEIKQTPHSIKIAMRMLTPIYYSGNLPKTISMLRKHIPSILRCQCFNSAGHPFRQEVKDTEIGHLFEHLIIEYMCQEKLASGARSATFSAVTYWNWNKEPKGTFHIEIESSSKNFQYFYPSLVQATVLLNKIIDTKYETKSHLQPSYTKPSTLHF